MSAGPGRRLAAALAAGALAGKLLGLARELATARLLGAGLAADAFRGGLTAALMPAAPFQGEATAAALVPLRRDWGAADPRAAARRSGALVLALGVLSVALAGGLWLAAPAWVGLLLGGLGPEARALTTGFTRVLVLAVPASIVSSALGAVGLACGRPGPSALRSVWQNLGVLAGLAGLVATGDPLALAWGFVAGFHAVLLHGLVELLRHRALAVRGLAWADLRAAGGPYLRRGAPLLPAPLLAQGCEAVERLLASGMATGTLGALGYARTLTETALYLVGQPVGHAVLAAGAREGAALRAQARALADPLLALGLPTSALLALFAPELVAVVFGGGAFDAGAVAATAAILRGAALGLWASTLGWVLLRPLNAAGRNGAAAGALAAAFGANVLVVAGLASPLGPLALGLGEAARGLALLAATALALGCGRLLLGRLAAALPATLALAAAAWAAASPFAEPWARLAAGGGVLGIGALARFAVLVPARVRALIPSRARALMTRLRPTPAGDQAGGA